MNILRKLAVILILLSPMAANADPVVTADVVYVDSAGRHWVEILETVGMSWNDVASVCDTVTGECAGILDRSVSAVGSFPNGFHPGDLDMTGLFWASADEVAELFYEAAGLPLGSLDSGRAEFPSADGIGLIFEEFFAPTLIVESGTPLESSFFDGFARSSSSCSLASQPLVVLRPQENPVESNVFDVKRCGAPDVRDLFGGWYYYAPVPEPSTLALLALGLAGMAARRKKKV